jgi:hypothetical protein
MINSIRDCFENNVYGRFLFQNCQVTLRLYSLAAAEEDETARSKAAVSLMSLGGPDVNRVITDLGNSEQF